MIPIKTDTLYTYSPRHLRASPDFHMCFLLSILRPGISTWERCRVGKPTFGPSCCWRLGCIRLPEKPWAPTGPDISHKSWGENPLFFLKKSFLEGTDSITYIIYSIWALQVSLQAWLNLISSQVDFPALTQVFAEQNQCTDRCHSVNQQYPLVN